MKPIRLLLLPVCLLFSVAFVLGQDTPSVKKNFEFFPKGKNSYTLMENGYYGYSKNSFNGQDRGHSNRTYIDLECNHWFGGGIGAGLSVESSWSGSHYNSTDQLSRSWSISPNVAYGKTLNDHWGAYARAELSFGVNKDIYKVLSVSTTDKGNTFGYGVTVGFPYRFSKYTAITPTLNYDYSQVKTDDSKEKDNGFGFGFHLEDYLSCNQIKCDHSTGFKLSQDKYDQGSGFIDYETHGSFFHGNNTFTYTGAGGTFKNKHSGINLDLNGSYYAIDYVGIGGGLRFSNMVQKSTDNTTRYTWNNFEFDPEVTINAPVNNGWRNLFVKGGGYFGSNKTETKSGSITLTDKSSISGFNAGIGYYGFFAEETALKTCIYYRSLTIKDKDSDDKQRQKGWAVSVGIAHSF